MAPTPLSLKTREGGGSHTKTAPPPRGCVQDKHYQYTDNLGLSKTVYLVYQTLTLGCPSLHSIMLPVGSSKWHMLGLAPHEKRHGLGRAVVVQM